MTDDQTLSCILEFILLQPISQSYLNSLLLVLPLSPPISPRLRKLLLLRRLASPLPVSTQTLDALETIEQLDRDHCLSRSPPVCLQLAYVAVAVDLTVKFLSKDRELGGFFDAVNRIWNRRVEDLEGSEAGKRLMSKKLREGRRLMEEAVVNRVVRVELMRRETGKEAAEAVRAYLKEAFEEMGPSVIQRAATAAVLAGTTGGGECVKAQEMLVGKTDAPIQDRCSARKLDHLHVSEVIQEKDQAQVVDDVDYNSVQEPLPDVVLTEATAYNSDLGRSKQNQSQMEKEKMTSFDEGDESGISRGACYNKIHDSVKQPTFIVQRQEYGKADQNLLNGNSRVVSLDKGMEAICPEGTSSAAVKRSSHAVSIMDRNSTARAHEWNDDIDESTKDPLEESPNPSDNIHVLGSKKMTAPVTKKLRNKEYGGRRMKKWWSVEEEDTLREAVKKYGTGKWMFIKNSYATIFEDRTSVDLKDKWRNMIK